MLRVLACSVVVTLVSMPAVGLAQGLENGSSGATIVIDGSPAPEPPETITRDARGRATVRAGDAALFGRRDGSLEAPPASATIPDLYVIDFRYQ